MSEQQAEQVSGGSATTEPVVSPQASAAPALATPETTDAAVPAIHQVESSMIAPDHEAPKADAPKIELVKSDQAKSDQVKSDQAKPDVAKPDQPKSEPIRLDQIKPDPIKIEPAKIEPMKAEAPKLAGLAAAAPALEANPAAKSDVVEPAAPKPDASRAGRLLMAPVANDSVRAEAVFSAASTAARANARPETPSSQAVGGDASGRAGRADRADPPRAAAAPSAGRALPIAAMLALTVAAGAVGGAVATAALVRASGGQAEAAATSANSELSASVAKLENDLAALKASLDQANQSSLVELNKNAERLDKVEKAQGELAKAVKPGELQKLSEAVERLRTAQAPAATTTAAREATGSVSPTTPQGTAVAAAGPTAQPAAPAPAVGRLPIVEGWVLRDVGRGSALIEGRQGLYEVFAGDPVPGLGKVDAIRRQDGRWVVVTTRGLVVAR